MSAPARALQLCASVHAAAAAEGVTDAPSLALLDCLRQCFEPAPALPPAAPPAPLLRARLFAALHANPERALLPQPHLRQAFLAVACLEAAQLLAQPPAGAAAPAAALQALDTAQLLAGPASALLQELTAAALAAAAAAGPPPYLLRPLPSLPPQAVAAVAAAAAAAAAGAPVPSLHQPSARAFAAAAASRSAAPTPLHLTGALAHWPALAPPAHAAAPDRRWHSLAYLARACGLRTVPVELGSDAASGGYMAPGFDVRLWRLGDYLADVVAPSVEACLAQAGSAGGGGDGGGSGSSGGEHVGRSAPYMAQHALFDACPALLADICTPDYIYCCFDGGGSGGGEPAVRAQAWLGPSGTYTPLHCDAAHNVLAQVVGVKRVRLLPPGAAPHVYAAPPPLQNTSLLPRAALRQHGRSGGGSDASAVSDAAAAFPLLRQCPLPLQEVVLAPGDALFIPRGWWHEVEALTPSFSVSFWW